MPKRTNSIAFNYLCASWVRSLSSPPRRTYRRAHPGENIHLPHHLITPANIGLVHAAFEGESSRNYATNVVGSDEAAAV